MKKAKEYRLVFSTTNSIENAKQIAKIAVNERLAACCTILPNATSIYYWEGEVQEDVEYQMIFKTSIASLESLEARIKELHPYDVPEIVATEIEEGSEEYLQWISDSTE